MILDDSQCISEITNKDLETISSPKSRIRLVFIFSVGEIPKEQLLATLARNFKLLKGLDLQDAPLDEIHEDVGNLLHLRYLIPGVKIQGGIGHLEELQTLHFVEANEDLNKELENLRQLRKLGIKNLKKEHGKAFCTAIEMMNHLQSLVVYKAIDGDGILDLHSLSSVPESLQHLNLNGRLGT
ncbi:hypothetical protein RHSIM_Rhsim02G0080800 [Rhododendron simsii]|uniref:Disease resistance R13L4/SHOC-2-like LRR domain-containing protein n=1 Tax=Rhododendron simsii TaxID=118357 RepID=A0A834HB31_RHOSS|nr:hypothetical protein RHSIM_Rhsim02G0080800 [Rhododendron simsii]